MLSGLRGLGDLASPPPFLPWFFLRGRYPLKRIMIFYAYRAVLCLHPSEVVDRNSASLGDEASSFQEVPNVRLAQAADRPTKPCTGSPPLLWPVFRHAARRGTAGLGQPAALHLPGEARLWLPRVLGCRSRGLKKVPALFLGMQCSLPCSNQSGLYSRSRSPKQYHVKMRKPPCNDGRNSSRWIFPLSMLALPGSISSHVLIRLVVDVICSVLASMTIPPQKSIGKKPFLRVPD